MREFLNEKVRVYAETSEIPPFIVGETTKTTFFSRKHNEETGEIEAVKNSSLELKVKKSPLTEDERIIDAISSGKKINLYFMSENRYIELATGELEYYLPQFTLILRHSEPIRLTEKEAKEFVNKTKDN